MQNSHLKNSLIAAGIAVFAGVVTLGANVAFGDTAPGAQPSATTLVTPTFNGLDVRGDIQNTVTGNVGIGGGLNVAGNVNLGKTLTTTGSTYLNGNLLTLGNTNNSLSGGELNFIGVNTAIKAIRYIIGLGNTLYLQASPDPSTSKIILKQGTGTSSDGIGIFGNLHGSSEFGGPASLSITGKVNAPSSDITAANLTASGTVSANTLKATNTAYTWDLNVQNNIYGWNSAAFIKGLQAGDDSTGTVNRGSINVITDGLISGSDYSKAGLTIGVTGGAKLGMDYKNIDTDGNNLSLNGNSGRDVSVGSGAHPAKLYVNGVLNAGTIANPNNFLGIPLPVVVQNGLYVSSGKITSVGGFGTTSHTTWGSGVSITGGGTGASSSSCGGSKILLACGYTGGPGLYVSRMDFDDSNTCYLTAGNLSGGSIWFNAKAICLDPSY